MKTYPLPNKPQFNFESRACAACGVRITCTRLKNAPGLPQPYLWVNVDYPHETHNCEKKVKIYTPEEIAEFAKERGLNK